MSLPSSAPLREPWGQDLLAAGALLCVWLCVYRPGEAEVSLPRLCSGGKLEFRQRMVAIHGGVCSRTWCAAQGIQQPCVCNSQAWDGNPTLLGSDREGKSGRACPL